MTKVTKPIAAHHLAELCKLAYAKPDEAIVAYQNLGYEAKVFNDGEMYVLSNNIIVFRGSDNFRDWAYNLAVAKTHGGRHFGFWKRYCTFHLGGIANSETIFIGHSLGAAMAAYAAHQYEAIAITFGEPMNSDRPLSDIKTHIRYVNNMDIVPKLPGVAFKHSGELRYIDYDGKIHTNPSWTQVIKDRIKSRWKAISKWQKFDDFYDHYPIEYINKLK